NNQTFSKKKEDNSNKNGTQRGDDDTPFDGEDGSSADDFANDPDSQRNQRRKDAMKDAATADADGYAKWECPWSLTFNYSVNYGYGAFDYNKMEYKGKWTQNLSFSGNIRPTTNWNFSFSASYNFDLKKIAYMNCSLSRDLHCFTMSASFVPFGPYKSYNFHISVKSSLLKDLKYDKRSSNTNGIQWY
ncbi:MAG: LPS-assembly protein LptD, partial [Muribaculaceae bacterium]|nr:LPS-assembly protein LptD [Muribaculaceae bacterium]